MVASIFQQKRLSRILPSWTILLLVTLLLLIGTGECLSSPAAKKTATATATTTKLFSSSVSTTSVDNNEKHYCFDAPLPERVEVLIAGGGLGGLATCIALRNRGIDAHVIEASPTLLRGSTGTGIMISPNGFSALDSISISISKSSDSTTSNTSVTSSSSSDLSEKMKGFGARIRKQRIRFTDPTTGNVTKDIKLGGFEEQYGTDQYNVGWARAHEVLASSIAPEAQAIHTGCTLESFEAYPNNKDTGKDDSVLVTLEDGRTVRASLLIGADGFGSKVRRLLAGDKKCRTRYNGQLLWNAIVPTDQFPTIAPHGEGQVEFITCGNDGQAILAFDAGEGKTAWYLTLMEEDAPAIVTNAIQDGNFGGFGPQPGVKSELMEVYEKWPMALECLAATPEDQIFERRQADRPRLWKWSSRSRSRGAGGRVVLMGDAAHPMIPSLGQGTMVTWEDAAELATCLAPLSGNGEGADSTSTSTFDASGVPKAVKDFVRRRAKRCANVQSLSRERRMGRTLPKFFPLKMLAIFKMIRAKNGAGDLYGYTSRDAPADATVDPTK